MAEGLYGSLDGKNALIIGNGKMGLLAAEALLKKGCGVCITLRRYKHGDNIVPSGARTIDYAKRAEVFGKSDFIMSATRSPHYTIFKRDIAVCENKPNYIFDLAVPRDVEPGTERYAKCFDIDALGGGETVDAETINGIKEIAKKTTEDFVRWQKYREGLT
jgi:glutamyl-tRNA reductase